MIWSFFSLLPLLMEDVKQDGRDLLGHERRLIRIETMIEMSGRRGRKPGIEG